MDLSVIYGAQRVDSSHREHIKKALMDDIER